MWWAGGCVLAVYACSVCLQCEVSVSVHMLLRWQPLVRCTMGRWFPLRT